MDVGNLSVNQPAHEDIRRIAYDSGRAKDRPALCVSPPTAADRFPGNGISQGRNGTLTALQDDPVLRYECERFIVGYAATHPVHLTCLYWRGKSCSISNLSAPGP